jgi:hypothetical protein
VVAPQKNVQYGENLQTNKQTITFFQTIICAKFNNFQTLKKNGKEVYS